MDIEFLQGNVAGVGNVVQGIEDHITGHRLDIAALFDGNGNVLGLVLHLKADQVAVHLQLRVEGPVGKVILGRGDLLDAVNAYGQLLGDSKPSGIGGDAVHHLQAGVADLKDGPFQKGPGLVFGDGVIFGGSLHDLDLAPHRFVGDLQLQRLAGLHLDGLRHLVQHIARRRLHLFELVLASLHLLGELDDPPVVGGVLAQQVALQVVEVEHRAKERLLGLAVDLLDPQGAQRCVGDLQLGGLAPEEGDLLDRAVQHIAGFCLHLLDIVGPLLHAG